MTLFRAIALFVIVVVPVQAVSAAPCMTESEARRAYSSAHLYWHGADHCWDASPGRVHGHEKPRHHYVRRHRDDDETEARPVFEAQPQLAKAEPQSLAPPQPQLVAQTEPQLSEEPPPTPALTSTDLIRAGHARIIEGAASKFRERWAQSHGGAEAKPALMAGATAEVQSTVSVGLVLMSVGGVVVICAMLVSFGARRSSAG